MGELLLYLHKNDLFMSLRPDVHDDCVFVTFRKTLPTSKMTMSSRRILREDFEKLSGCGMLESHILELAKDFMLSIAN